MRFSETRLKSFVICYHGGDEVVSAFVEVKENEGVWEVEEIDAFWEVEESDDAEVDSNHRDVVETYGAVVEVVYGASAKLPGY